MRQRGRTFWGLAILGAVSLVAAACGGGGGGGNGGSGSQIVIGTTDKVVSFDPAGEFDLGSGTPMSSMYQGLLRFDPGSTTPTPDAAKSCRFTDKLHYECTLAANQKFWNGDPVTAQDVKFSFDRNLKIASPNGASSLLGVLKSTAAEGKDKVVFTLKYPFTVFPFLLTDTSFAIVDKNVFPAKKVLDSAKIVGSGPYMMAKYTSGSQLVLKPNPHYGGTLKLANKGVVVQYYTKASALKLDIEQGDVDVAFREFSPTDIASLKKESSKGVQVVEGQGAEIQYLVFNQKIMPGDSAAQKLAIRRAAAYIVNRQAIASDVYNGTVTPLYSMVPSALPGHLDVFKDAYGPSPNVAKAKSTLRAAGVKTPVPLTIWWTPSHYGEPSADMYTDIKRQLQASGLFTITLKNAEWDTYEKAAFTDQYPAFQLGWFPDYPDSDDYTNSFYAKDSFLNDHFSDPKVDADVQTERGNNNQARRVAAFQDIQRVGAAQVPMIPLWEGKQIAVQRKGVTGVKQTLDVSYTFRYWLIGKSNS